MADPTISLDDRFFPRLGSVSPETEAAELPPFFEVLLSLATSAPERLTCVVLPRIWNSSLILATLVALRRFREQLPALLAEYARTEFRDGDIVRVNPSNFVYEYAGFFDHPGSRFFKLRILNTRDGDARACPADDLLRLQRTDRRTPRGKVNSDLGVLAETCLDQLLGVRTLGNTAIFRNEVILHSTRATFESFLQNTFAEVERRNSSGCDTIVARLCDVLPWGTIADDFALRTDGAAGGSPLCAVTSDMTRMRGAVESLPSNSTVVVVDGARRVQDISGIQAIADRQRVLVLADLAEVRHVEALRGAGVTVWQPDADEILGDRRAANRRSGVAGQLIRAAEVLRSLRLDTRLIGDTILDDVAVHLREAEAALNDDTDRSAKQLIADCFGLLLDLGSWCTVPEPARIDRTMQRIQGISDRLRVTSLFISDAIRGPLDSALAGLLDFAIDHSESPTPKLANLSAMLTRLEGAGERSIVLVRSAASAGVLSDYLTTRWRLSVVVSGRAIPPDAQYTTTILVGWPGRELLDHVVGRLRTPEICLIGYRYEQEWMKGYQYRRSQLTSAWSIDGEERARILGLPPTQRPIRGAPVESTTRDLDALLSAMHLERLRTGTRKGTAATDVPESDAREAKYVDFFGDAYAYLTRSHQVPRLNALVGDDSSRGSVVEHVTVDALRQGDFVLFRDVGESDVIALIADEMGGERYRSARKLAESWRPVLRSIASDRKTIVDRLRQHGLKHTPAAVYSWLSDPSRIGPQDESDLRVIANAAGNMALFENAPSVFKAICDVRGAHLSAGTRLTQLLLAELPDKIGHLDGEETDVNLTFGTAWIVQVATVGTAFERRSYMEVNRLLRADRDT